jgi:hypothetical protein
MTMAEYEFTAEENEVFASLSRRMSRFGMVFVAIGIIGALETIFSSGGGKITSIEMRDFIKAGYYILSGLMIWQPAVNFRNIVQVKGSDVTNVLDAVKKLSAGMGYVSFLQILNILVLLLDIGNVF